MGSGVVLTEAEREIADEFESIRTAHRLEDLESMASRVSLQPRCVCGAAIVVLYDDDGRTLFNPWTRHLSEEFAKAVAARVERALAEQREVLVEELLVAAREERRAGSMQGASLWRAAAATVRDHRQDPTDG